MEDLLPTLMDWRFEAFSTPPMDSKVRFLFRFSGFLWIDGIVQLCSDKIVDFLRLMICCHLDCSISFRFAVFSVFLIWGFLVRLISELLIELRFGGIASGLSWLSSQTRS